MSLKKVFKNFISNIEGLPQRQKTSFCDAVERATIPNTEKSRDKICFLTHRLFSTYFPQLHDQHNHALMLSLADALQTELSKKKGLVISVDKKNNSNLMSP